MRTAAKTFLYCSDVRLCISSSQVYRGPVKCGMRIAENRKHVKYGMLRAEKYCGTKGKMQV